MKGVGWWGIGKVTGEIIPGCADKIEGRIKIALLVNCYSSGLLSLIRQFFLTPNRINEFMDLRL
jgi:hypothetical protein